MLESGALFLGATFGTLQSDSPEPLLTLRGVFTELVSPKIPWSTEK
jgi:hypothetical protein